MTPEAMPRAGGSFTFSYDDLDRLTSRTIPGGSSGFDTTGLYAGRTLIGETKASGTLTYTQDTAAGLSQILQRNDGSAATSYIYGATGRLVEMNGSTRTWDLADDRGTLRSQIGDSAVPSGRATYTPYGSRSTEGNLSSIFGYLGEHYDAPWNMSNMRDRWYDPGYGFFYGRDPVLGTPQQPMSFNPYQYAYDSPLVYSDPSGRCVGWLWGSEECKFAGADPRNWNIEDGAKYAEGVASNVTDPVLGVYTIAVNAEAREAAWQQLQNIRLANIPGMIVNGIIDPFRNLYYGFVCDDSYLLGKGAGGVGIEVISTAAGISAARRLTQVESVAARLPDASELRLSRTVAKHEFEYSRQGIPSRPYMKPLVRNRIIQEIMDAAPPTPDPAGYVGFLRWEVEGFLGKTPGFWELVIDTNTNTVVHFLFKGTR